MTLASPDSSLGEMMVYANRLPAVFQALEQASSARNLTVNRLHSILRII